MYDLASEDGSGESEDVSGTGGNMGAASEGVNKLAICQSDENLERKTKSLFHAPVPTFCINTNTSKLGTTSKLNPMSRSKMHNFEFSRYNVCQILENSLLLMLKG